MGSFYSLVNNLISNIPMNDHDENIISKPCGQSGCCSLHPPLRQQEFNLHSVSPNMIIENKSQTSSIKRNQRRSISKTRTRKSKNNLSSGYSLLSKDEESLLEHVLDAYITHKGSQDLMAKSLAHKLNTDITKMKILCRTLCQLIEAKIQ